jgi:hypothetical protein
MDTFTSPVSAGSVVVSADPLRLAVSAYLARFKGISREHTYSDLHVFVTCVLGVACSRWPPGAATWSCSCAGCRRAGGSSPRR